MEDRQPVLRIPPILTEVGGWVLYIQITKEEAVRASTPMFCIDWGYLLCESFGGEGHFHEMDKYCLV